MNQTAQPASLARRIAGQSLLLFAGYGFAQFFSLLRNALIGHVIAKGDFGVATAITLVLQTVETLTDLGADRLIIQAPDGDKPRVLATAHTLLVMRGLLLSFLLIAASPFFARSFGAAFATDAFAIAALAPAIKGFLHLDIRRAQRHFDNRPQIAVEVLPQALALLVTFPVLHLIPDYGSVVALTLLQAIAAVAASHALARAPYRLAFERDVVARQLTFGWPILASALPLVAVFQGDRLLIAHFAGLEALAEYTAAFMVTMVPGLIAAKVGHALLLPLFSEALRSGRNFAATFKLATEATVVLAATYLAAFIAAGDVLLPLVFGPKYAGLGTITAWLAAMWSVRMLQAVPGMALMASGTTRPFLTAGIIRALALPVVALAAANAASLATLAATGVAFEVASLLYVCWRISRLQTGLGSIVLRRTLYLAPVAIASLLLIVDAPQSGFGRAIAAAFLLAAVSTSGIALMPSLNALARQTLHRRPLAAH